MQAFASTDCGIDYSIDPEQERRELHLYNAYQLVSQLAFTSITLAEALSVLDSAGGDISKAAGVILSKFEHS